jgi:hypothetical protein
MRTTARITFTEFDTTSEVSGLDGSTYIVVTIHFTIDAGSGPRPASASIGISTRQGRRTYELVEPTWAYQPPLSGAILDYVREAERLFRSAHAGQEHGDLSRTVELELDLSALPL